MALAKDSPITEPAKQLSLFFKKLKRLNPIEPSLGLLGFFLLSALFLTTFVCFDYDTVLTGLRSGGAPDMTSPLTDTVLMSPIRGRNWAGTELHLRPSRPQ